MLGIIMSLTIIFLFQLLYFEHSVTYKRKCNVYAPFGLEKTELCWVQLATKQDKKWNVMFTVAVMSRHKQISTEREEHRELCQQEINLRHRINVIVDT